MASANKRGSEKLMAAWKARGITEESVGEIAAALEKSPATVEQARVTGGTNPTGISLSLSYAGDDGSWCGNDILFWFKWHRKYGGGPWMPPKIIINGIPYPDWVRLELNFGQVGNPAPQELPGVAGL